MKNAWLAVGVVLAWLGSGAALVAQTSEVLLWPEGAPGARGTAPHDQPSLTPFPAPADRATGAAIVVCPGGGYGGLAGHEGKDYALYLNELGIHAFVLRYRLATHGYRHPRMLEDVSRAVRVVRARAEAWKVDPQRVGVMGSSAGGHLVATLLTHFAPGQADTTDPVERQSSRPDLGILCYPVITLGEFTHQGSRNNLLGPDPDPALVEKLSAEKQVTPQTPPAFIWHTVEDQAVPVENAMLFASALRRAGVPFDLHLYEKGRHGIGLANGHPWTRDLAFWLQEHRFVAR